MTGFHIPQAAIIGADFIGKNDLLAFIFLKAAEFQFEIHQTNTNAHEQPAEEIVDTESIHTDFIHLRRGRPAECKDMFFSDERIAERIIFIAIFDQRMTERFAFLHVETLGKAAGGNVTDDHFQRNNLHGFDELLAHVQRADKMGRNRHFMQTQHQVFGNSVVEHTLTVNHPFFHIVKCGSIILKMLDQRSGFRPLKQLLCFAFIDRFARGHVDDLSFYWVHKFFHSLCHKGNYVTLQYCRMPEKPLYRHSITVFQDPH